MSQFIKPYNDDPFVGNLATPVSTSSFTRSLLGNLPAYRPGISPLFRGFLLFMVLYLLKIVKLVINYKVLKVGSNLLLAG